MSTDSMTLDTPPETPTRMEPPVLGATGSIPTARSRWTGGSIRRWRPSRSTIENIAALRVRVLEGSGLAA